MSKRKTQTKNFLHDLQVWWFAFLGKRIRGGDKKAAAIDSYGAPGRGKSGLISVVTVSFILIMWWLSTQPWEYLANRNFEDGLLVPSLFLPSPYIVWQKFLLISCAPTYWQELQNFLGWAVATPSECIGFNDSTLWQHTLASLKRVFTAFVLAVILGVPVGISMGMSRIPRGVFDPPIEFYRPIPPLAYLPLTIIWFGIGDVSKVILIFLACFAPLALNARAGVRSVSIEQIHAAYSMGASSTQVVWHVVLKGALPEILTGMRVAIAFGWTTLVAAEMVAAKAGIGVMVLNAARYLATDIVFLGIIVIGLIAYSFDLIMRWFERTFVPWKGKAS